MIYDVHNNDEKHMKVAFLDAALPLKIVISLKMFR